MMIDKSEVLRYLGYTKQVIDPNTDQLLNDCLLEIKELIRPGFVSKVFEIHKNGKTIALKNTILRMESRDLANHLFASDHCTLMAASLGLEVDLKIAYYAKTHLTKSLILDACASTAIESLCDQVQAAVAKEACELGYYITSRFSPGYGDLPISLQKPITQVLATYKAMGLTATENNILLPRKSVTAIMGWQKEAPTETINRCQLCNKENCNLRKADDHGKTHKF